MATNTFLSADGSWGAADGILMFDINELPEHLLEMLYDDPEGAYSPIYEWLNSYYTPTT